METRANYLIVGVFVVVLFVGALAFVLWLAKFQSDSAFSRYDIYFSGSVSGLRPGSTVSYRGINVGEVANVVIDPENVEQVLVTIEIAGATPIKEDTKASVEIQGLAGGSLVMLTGGTEAAPTLVARDGQRHPVIQSRKSGLEQLLAGAPALVEKVDVLVERAALLLGNDNREAFGNILDNLDTFTETLAIQSVNIAATIESASSVMSNLNGAMVSLERLSKALEKDLPALPGQALQTLGAVDKTLKKADGLLDAARLTTVTLDSVGKEVQGLVAENRRPIRDFTNSTLYETSSFITELRELVVGLNRFTTDVGRDPASFIFGGQRKGYEAK